VRSAPRCGGRDVERVAVAVSTPYTRATAMLDAVSWRGIKPGLERTRALLHVLGDPHVGLSGVLVAGTNGKGSVCAVIDSITHAAGLRTVMLTKPHLRSYTERIVIDGVRITEEDFAALMEEVNAAAATLPEDLQPTGFEMLTAAGLLQSARAAPDVVVCEVGLGGRLDSTNVLDLGVAIVTNVALDHREHLGDTVVAIAREKAAVIKAGDDAVTAAGGPALDVIRRHAHEVGAPLTVVTEDVPVNGRDGGLAGIDVDTEFAGLPIALHAPLVGWFQAANIATAVTACDVLRRRGAAIDAGAVSRGCASTQWPGRMQWVRGSPPILVDGAHNPAGMAAMVEAARAILAGRRIVVLFAAMRNKDVDAMIAELRGLGAAETVVTSPAVERASDVADLARFFDSAHTEAIVSRGLSRARMLAGRDGAVVVTGSLYLAGEVLSLLET